MYNMLDCRKTQNLRKLSAENRLFHRRILGSLVIRYPSRAREMLKDLRFRPAGSPGKTERSFSLISNSVTFDFSWIHETRYSIISDKSSFFLSPEWRIYCLLPPSQNMRNCALDMICWAATNANLIRKSNEIPSFFEGLDQVFSQSAGQRDSRVETSWERDWCKISLWLVCLTVEAS